MRYSLKVMSIDAALMPLRFVLMVALPASFFGYDVGALFLNANFLSGYYILGSGDLNVIIGTAALGMLLGYFLGGYLTYGSGRKICIISCSLLGTLAIVSSFFAPSLSVMLCAQFVIGFTFGVYFLATILYIQEITLPGNRGFASSLVFLSLILGGLIAAISQGSFPATGNFLILVSFCALNFVILVLAIFKIPESPRFLAISGVPDAALPILFKLRLDMGVAARELAGINECCRQAERGSELFLQNANFRRLIWALLSLTLLINLSGFLLIPYFLGDLIYASDPNLIYNYYDFYSGLLHAALIVGSLGLITACISIDRLGRRQTLLFGAALAIFSLIFLFLIAFFEPPLAAILVSIFAVVYVFAGALVIPTFFCVLVAELVPTRSREFGFTAVLIFNTIVSLGCTQILPMLINYIHFSGWFVICLLSAISLFVLIYQCVPNTANSSLEGIESRLLAGNKLKKLGQS